MNCKNCKSDCAEKGIDHEKQSCLGYLGNTNADRVRSMTDEELAEFISNQIIDRNIGVPIETWLDWLQQK